MPGLTPFQTVGPFFAIALGSPGAARVADAATAGRCMQLTGIVRDGAGAPVPDALVESWQADHQGHHARPTSPAATGFSGWGRAHTDAEGRYAFVTIMPGRIAGPGDALQAAHLVLGVFARGLLNRLVTRAYFEGEPGLAEDPVLQCVPADRRHTLVARHRGDGQYEMDIVLQGHAARETVFFDV
jgi:protocatechuate 3,4-dioxygenase, alpha subunit